MQRRDVLKLAVGLGAACARRGPNLPLSAPARRRVPTVPETNFDVATGYPEIPLLRDEAYVKRRARMRDLARAARADIVVATSGAKNFAYLVGGDCGRSERLIALLVPVDGEPLLVAPSFEVPRVRKVARAVEVQGWEETEDPVARIADWVRRKHARAALLIEPRTDYVVAAALARALPDATLVDGAHAFEELRIVKTDEELARMRRAIRILEDAFAATFARLEVGLEEKDVAAIVHEEAARRGVEGGALVQFGANAALPHGAPTSATLRDGMVVLLDGGCTFQGWYSDITRTRWFGHAPPTERFRTLYNLVHDAQTAAIARARPGVPAQEVDRAARQVIAKGGFGERFTHRLGHGIGMEGHEAAYIVEGNERPLAPGFVFSVEPGIYLPGEIGVRIEDIVACSASGSEVMSRRAPRL